MRTSRARASRVGDSPNPVYLDCNATSPVEPEVSREVIRYLTIEFGNAGSRTHQYGTKAKQAVQCAREQVAAVVDATPDEVVFTSGATESNNLAILGLADHGTAVNRKHIISTYIEHKAVLEPLEALTKRGFEITLLRPTAGGWVDPEELSRALRSDTLLVSVMHANNETGVTQPIREMSRILLDHPAYFHVDAAQGFGKDIETLRQKRIDLISVSGHKVYAPKGVGALVVRRRGYRRLPLTPLIFGGGQERGLRPGTLPVPLVVGFGLAAELAYKHNSERLQACQRYRQTVLEWLSPLGPTFNGDQERTLPHVLNISFPGLDSEAVMVALKDLVAFSNGSACTSHKYEPSHVLLAMGLAGTEVQRAVRLSWCHMSEEVDWARVVEIIESLS
ncbi:MAG: cysteine desulfurase [Blastocatellia bacterium]|jgi:cysteine desulfurase|nr:cysteine desulfurase [Blastocatellia bacterium]